MPPNRRMASCGISPAPLGQEPLHREREIPYVNGVLSLYAPLSQLPSVVVSLDRNSLAAIRRILREGG